MKFVFWWDSPCKGMIGVLREFCARFSPESVVITGDTGTKRRNMGWNDVGQLFSQHVVINRQDNWVDNTTGYMHQYTSGYIHIFNGIDRDIFNHLVKKAHHENIRYGFMTEAYSNLEYGIKRVLKNGYLKIYLPIKLKRITSKSEIVFCLSGKKSRDIAQLQNIGFDKEKIIPFGYWTDINEPVNAKTSKDSLQIICPGVLEKYKGVEILLRAVKVLTSKGITNLCCHITGTGSMERHLKSLTKSFKIEQNIVFYGVLSQNEYDDLIVNMDILVAPGYNEPWGIRVNESIQRGQPVICSDGLGASDLIAESGCGMVFQKGNYKQLADYINVYLSDKNRVIQDMNYGLLYKDKISCRTKSEELFNGLTKLDGDEVLK